MNINPALDPQNEDPAAFSGMHYFQPNESEALFPAPEFQSKNSLLVERLSRNKDHPAVAMNSDRIFAKQLVILLVLGGTLAICSLSKKKELPLVATQKASVEPASRHQVFSENPSVGLTSPEPAKNWTPPTREENAARAMRRQWAKFITAEHSNYGYGVLGGINNLSVLFSNHTDYPLEEVRVRITIVKRRDLEETGIINVQPEATFRSQSDGASDEKRKDRSGKDHQGAVIKNAAELCDQ